MIKIKKDFFPKENMDEILQKKSRGEYVDSGALEIAKLEKDYILCMLYGIKKTLDSHNIQSLPCSFLSMFYDDSGNFDSNKITDQFLLPNRDTICRTQPNTIWDSPISRTDSPFPISDNNAPTLGDVLKKILDYQKYIFAKYTRRTVADLSRDYEQGELRHKILNVFGVSVCPYCNREYITDYSDAGNKKSTAAIDHFKPKDKYPEYSLALFNFVPACNVCNTLTKKTNAIDLLNPFIKAFGEDYVFKIMPNDPNNTEAILSILTREIGTNTNQVKLSIELAVGHNENGGSNNITAFKLNQVYESHTQYACDLLRKSKLFSDDSYRRMMSKQYDALGFNLDDKTWDMLLYGFDWNDENIDPEKPLSKMAYDIIKR